MECGSRAGGPPSHEGLPPVKVARVLQRSSLSSPSVRAWRRRRLTAALTVAALGAGAGSFALAHRSDANAASGYEPVTLADTAFPIPSGALFVNPSSGADSNPGTQAAPFATLGRALAVAPSGSTIVLRGGQYRESLSLNRPVTIQAYPHEQPWMTGTDVVGGFAGYSGLWAKSWTSPLCDTCLDPTSIDPNYPAAGLPEMVFVDGAPLRQVTSLNTIAPDAFYYDASKHLLYLGADPNGHTVEVANRAYALRIGSAASGSTVRGVGFEQYGASSSFSSPQMVTVTGTNVTLDHDTFAWSASRGLSVLNSGAVVTNSLFLYNGSNGFHANNADGLVFQHNRVAWSNAEHFSITPSASATQAGAKLTHTWNSVVSDNIFDDNGANALWYDVTSTNAVIANNTFLRNAGHGIAYEVSGRAIIAGNLVAANGRDGIKLSGASGAEVWNNTIAGNGWSQIGVYEDPRTDNNPADNAAGITYDTSNVRIVNNIVVAPAGTTRAVLESFDISSPRHLTSAQMISADDHNLWSRPSTTSPTVLSNWETTLSAQTQYKQLSTWSTGTGREGNSAVADNVPASALFTAPANDDYSPLAGGPAAVAGVNVPPAIVAAMGVGPSVLLGAPNPPSLVTAPAPVTTTTAPAPTTTTAPATTTTTAPVTTTTTAPVTTTTVAPPPAVVPALSVDNVQVKEGRAGTKTTLVFAITLSQPSASPVTVSYATANGSASAGSDYVARSGSATFPPGVTTRHIVVDVIGDNVRETNETFTAHLSNASGATVANGVGTGTILNDD